MAPKRATPPRLPLLVTGRVAGWDAVVSLDGTNSRAVMLKVSLLEPIKKRLSAVINITEQSTNAQPVRPPSGGIGAWIAAIGKDDVLIHATVTNAEMTALLMLASGGRLKSCLLACPEPYRGRASIITLRVGTQEPEDLG